MTARKTRTPAPEAPTLTPEPSNSFSPSEGGNALAAAWQGIHNLFGGRYEKIELTPEGFTFTGVTVDPLYNFETIFNDIYRRGDKTVNPKLTLRDIYPLLSGETVAPFTNAEQITAWMVRHMKGGSRSPKYAKDANQLYKEANGFAVPRGRPRKIFHIKDIASLDVAQLQDVSPEEVEKLRHTLDTLAASQAAAVVEA